MVPGYLACVVRLVAVDKSGLPGEVQSLDIPEYFHGYSGPPWPKKSWNLPSKGFKRREEKVAKEVIMSRSSGSSSRLCMRFYRACLTCTSVICGEGRVTSMSSVPEEWDSRAYSQLLLESTGWGALPSASPRSSTTPSAVHLSSKNDHGQLPEPPPSTCSQQHWRLAAVGWLGEATPVPRKCLGQQHRERTWCCSPKPQRWSCYWTWTQAGTWLTLTQDHIGKVVCSKDPKHPMNPGCNTDDVSKCIAKMYTKHQAKNKYILTWTFLFVNVKGIECIYITNNDSASHLSTCILLHRNSTSSMLTHCMYIWILMLGKEIQPPIGLKSQHLLHCMLDLTAFFLFHLCKRQTGLFNNFRFCTGFFS